MIDMTPTTPKPSRKTRSIVAWQGRKTVKLSRLQAESLTKLYNVTEVDRYPNFSLTEVLRSDESLRDAFIPDDNIIDSQLQHETLSNRPHLWRMATLESDPFA